MMFKFRFLSLWFVFSLAISIQAQAGCDETLLAYPQLRLENDVRLGRIASFLRPLVKAEQIVASDAFGNRDLESRTVYIAEKERQLQEILKLGNDLVLKSEGSIEKAYGKRHLLGQIFARDLDEYPEDYAERQRDEEAARIRAKHMQKIRKLRAEYNRRAALWPEWDDVGPEDRGRLITQHKLEKTIQTRIQGKRVEAQNYLREQIAAILIIEDDVNEEKAKEDHTSKIEIDKKYKPALKCAKALLSKKSEDYVAALLGLILFKGAGWLKVDEELAELGMVIKAAQMKPAGGGSGGAGSEAASDTSESLKTGTSTSGSGSDDDRSLPTRSAGTARSGYSK